MVFVLQWNCRREPRSQMMWILVKMWQLIYSHLPFAVRQHLLKTSQRRYGIKLACTVRMWPAVLVQLATVPTAVPTSCNQWITQSFRTLYTVHYYFLYSTPSIVYSKSKTGGLKTYSYRYCLLYIVSLTSSTTQWSFWQLDQKQSLSSLTLQWTVQNWRSEADGE